jgi:hypothetical protein
MLEFEVDQEDLDHVVSSKFINLSETHYIDSNKSEILGTFNAMN